MTSRRAMWGLQLPFQVLLRSSGHLHLHVHLVRHSPRLVRVPGRSNESFVDPPGKTGRMRTFGVVSQRL